MLKKIVPHLVRRKSQGGTVALQHAMAPFVKWSISASGLSGILKPAGPDFLELAEILFSSHPDYDRGAQFSDFFNRLGDLLVSEFVGMTQDAVDASHVERLAIGLRSWFSAKCATHEIYLPCIITPRAAEAFAIGPVKFQYIDEFMASQINRSNPAMFDVVFGSMLEQMRASAAFWVATIEVENAIDGRARELAELSVDLAITALQIRVSNESEGMTRLDARTTPKTRFPVSRVNGGLTHGRRNDDPGLTWGAGFLEMQLRDGRSLFESVGRRVEAFLTRSGPIIGLERAWTDAAYWFHEALAEPLDTIAIAKFETAAEVLFRAANGTGSERRVREAIEIFLGLKSDDRINPMSETTVKQFAKRLVSHRSQILHGTLSTLNEPMRASRRGYEAWVRNLLADFATELEPYSRLPLPLDELDEFLSFVRIRKARS